MMSLIVLTPKRNVLGRNNVIWAINREHRSRGSSWACEREKKDRTGQDRTGQEKSHKWVIFHLRPHWSDVHKICLVCDVLDVITCAKFQNEILRGYDFIGGRIFHFPIDFWMGLTTCNQGTKVRERIHLLQLLILNEYALRNAVARHYLLLWTVLLGPHHSSGPLAWRFNAVWRMVQATSERSCGDSCLQYFCLVPFHSLSRYKPSQYSFHLSAICAAPVKFSPVANWIHCRRDLTIWKSCLEFLFEFAASNSTHMPSSCCCYPLWAFFFVLVFPYFSFLCRALD